MKTILNTIFFLYLSFCYGWVAADCPPIKTDVQYQQLMDIAVGTQNKKLIKRILDDCIYLPPQTSYISYAPDMETIYWFNESGVETFPVQTTQNSPNIYSALTQETPRHNILRMRMWLSVFYENEKHKHILRMITISKQMKKFSYEKYHVNLEQITPADFNSSNNQKLTEQLLEIAPMPFILEQDETRLYSTLLHYAVRIGELESTRALIKKAPSLLTQTDNRGLTPFDYLFFNSCNPDINIKEFVQLFLVSGYLSKQKNKINFSPIQIAYLLRNESPNVFVSMVDFLPIRDIKKEIKTIEPELKTNLINQFLTFKEETESLTCNP